MINYFDFGRFSLIALLAAPLWSAAAVPPPPVPRWFSEPRDEIARLKPVLGGKWLGQDSPTNPIVELRVGTFGDMAPSFLMVERITLESYGDFHKLSVLFYSSICHAFEMLPVDNLSGAAPINTGDCSGAFPINFHPDGALSFQYIDWNQEWVALSVDKQHWRETRWAPGITPKRQIDFVRLPTNGDWGRVQ